jgi:hypothetical protein
MTTIKDIRQQFPQYSDMSDDDLVSALHQKFYSDIPREEFERSVGHTPQGVLGRAGDWIAGAAKGAADMVRGQHDPLYKDVPAFDPAKADLSPERRGPVMEDQATAKVTTFSDEAYGDILKSSLGDAFVGMSKDANGYPLVTYKDKGGREVTQYVNKPGLDWQDLDRGVSSALPYIVGGGAAAQATKNAGMLARAGAQALTAGGVSLAQDAVAATKGSEQGVDLPRATTAAGFGAAGELVAPAVSMGWRWLKGAGKSNLDDAGKLTADAAAKARRAGLDPDQFTANEHRVFADVLEASRDEVEAAASFRSNRFGIPTSKGQRTKDPEFLAMEKDVRSGAMGQSGKDIMREFDDRQAKSIQGAALMREEPFKSGRGMDRYKGKPGDPREEGMGSMIAPTRTAVDPGDVSSGALSEGIKEGVRAAKTKADDIISKAWDDVTDVLPAPQAFERLPQALSGRLGGLPVDDILTPSAMRMAKDLDGFMAGKSITEGGPAVLQQTPVRTLDQMRRRLLAMREGAANNTDRAAAKAVYDGFNDWIDDISEQGMVLGKPESAAALRTAREVMRDIKSLFEPKRGGKATTEAKILADIVENDNNADTIVAKLFGSGRPHTPPKEGTVAALRQIKTTLFDRVRDQQLVEPMQAVRTWNDLRMAYWSKVVIDAKGKMTSPGVMKDNIEAAIRNQSQVVGTLFSPDEIGMMQQFAKALGEAAYKDPNPSGTATALRALQRNDTAGAIKQGVMVESQRQRFSQHNIWAARIYQFLANKVPADVLGSKDSAGAALARKVTSQKITPRAPAALGVPSATIGAEYGADR